MTIIGIIGRGIKDGFTHSRNTGEPLGLCVRTHLCVNFIKHTYLSPYVRYVYEKKINERG